MNIESGGDPESVSRRPRRVCRAPVDEMMCAESPPPLVSLPTEQTNAVEVNQVTIELGKLCEDSAWGQLLDRVGVNHPLAVVVFAMPYTGPRPPGTTVTETTIIHQALDRKNGDPDDRIALIEYIVQHAPEALKIRNSSGALPLHVLCMNGSRAGIKGDMRKRLAIPFIAAYPASTRETYGDFQRTPLHVLASRISSVSSPFFLAVLQADPHAATIEDSNGRLPIDQAR